MPSFEVTRKIDEQRPPSPNDSTTYWPIKWTPESESAVAAARAKAPQPHEGWDPIFGETATAHIPHLGEGRPRDRNEEARLAQARKDMEKEPMW